MRRPVAWISGFVALASFLVARPAFSECRGGHCSGHRAPASVYSDPQLRDAITIATSSGSDLVPSQPSRKSSRSKHKRRVTVRASSLWQKTPYSPQVFVKAD